MSAIPKLSPAAAAPRLSDRNAARFMRMPAPRQMRFLRDLKFPRNTPQVYKSPYYGPAFSGIREVFKRGFRGLIDARAKLEAVPNETRRRNLVRVLDAFAASPLLKRRLTVAVAHRYHAHIRTLELRLSPHLVAMEAGEARYMYFHEKQKVCDPEEARLTLAFGYWILKQNGADVRPSQFEMFDLFAGAHYVGSELDDGTLQTLEEMARLIESLWPTIEP